MSGRYLPNQPQTPTQQDAFDALTRRIGTGGKSGTFPLRRLTDTGEDGYLTFNTDGRLIDAKPPT